MQTGYDFSGWVTKNDLVCMDGVTIRKNAFQKNDSTTVPLVWNHKRDDPSSIIGKIKLENRPEGVYGYANFMDTPKAAYAKSAVKHGAIVAMSIAANNIKRNGNDVVGGDIFEVSLVTKGANPGAFIDQVIVHGSEESETIQVYLPYELEIIEHSAKEEQEMEQHELETSHNEGGTDILDNMTDEQLDLLEALLDENEELASNLNTLLEEREEMKHNAFENQNGSSLEHGVDLDAILSDFKSNRNARLSDVILEHGIESVDLLFPAAQDLNPIPLTRYPEGLAADSILSKVTKSPFARIKNRYMSNLGEDELITRGYVKGDIKQAYQIKKILSRETHPKTIYIKQKMDRDDVIDIKNFNIIDHIKKDMEVRFRIDLARFILIGDNRSDSDPDKVSEDNLRPIWSDSDEFTIKKTITDLSKLQEFLLNVKSEYKGSGRPTLFMNEKVMTKLRLMTDQNGKKLFSANGLLPTIEDMKAQLEVSDIVFTNFLTEAQMIYVDLADYSLGNDKGGEPVNFENFDIDRNQLTYLLEARLSGALTTPKSAIAITIGSYSKPSSPEARRDSDPRPVSTLEPKPGIGG